MSKIVTLVCKAVTLAMGIAVVVLSILKKTDFPSGFFFVGIGLTCAGIVFFQTDKDDK